MDIVVWLTIVFTKEVQKLTNYLNVIYNEKLSQKINVFLDSTKLI